MELKEFQCFLFLHPLPTLLFLHVPFKSSCRSFSVVRALEWSGQSCHVSSDSLCTMDLRISTPLRLLDSSVGKESACNAGDPCSIPALGRSPGEGIGYPFQYSWASLVAQTVKNLRAMRKIWVQSLDWEDPLEKGMPTHSSILA